VYTFHADTQPRLSHHYGRASDYKDGDHKASIKTDTALRIAENQDYPETLETIKSFAPG
jgi:hypothetical protein